MSDLFIDSKEFYSNYIFHPFKEELSVGDQFKAFVTSFALLVFTLGIVHIACYIKYRERTFSLQPNDPTTSKVEIMRVEKLSREALKDPKLSLKKRLMIMEQLINNDTKKENMETAYFCRDAAEIYRKGVDSSSKEEKVEKNIGRAITLLKIASGMRFGNATSELADIYISKEATLDNANEIYQFACEFGDNSDKRFDLMQLAAEKKHPQAMAEVADGYRYGRYKSVEKDIVKAIALYKSAAEKGASIACGSLANIYTFGDKEIPVNKEEGKRWLLLAFDKGAKWVAMTDSGVITRSTIISNKQQAIEYFNKP